MLKIIIYLILSYLCGAIPFGYIVAKLFRHVDIRTVGSGNPGATNVYRTISKPLGVLTLLLDMLKGFVPVYFVSIINPSSYLIVLSVALVTILGHVFTVFLNFKGGKGVATGCGIFFALSPLATTICLITFIIVLIISKYVSLGSIFAAVMLPIAIFFVGSNFELLIFAILVATVVIIRHISNIKRLLSGTENKIYGNKSSN